MGRVYYNLIYFECIFAGVIHNNTDFPRVLTLLRKERNISQKQAAAELGISQALLSHYEKGIRECGLDFLIRCANFYGVSCDYLLGAFAGPDRHYLDGGGYPGARCQRQREHLPSRGHPAGAQQKLIANSLEHPL